MKIFSIKRLIGLGAIYGAVQYARKHGGAKNAFNGLLDKAKDFAAGVKNDVASGSHDSSVSSSSSSPYSSSGIGSRSVGSTSSDVSSSGYGGSGLGGNGCRGY